VPSTRFLETSSFSPKTTSINSSIDGPSITNQSVYRGGWCFFHPLYQSLWVRKFDGLLKGKKQLCTVVVTPSIAFVISDSLLRINYNDNMIHSLTFHIRVGTNFVCSLVVYTNVTAQWLSSPSRRRLANYAVRLTRHKQEPPWPIRRWILRSKNQKVNPRTMNKRIATLFDGSPYSVSMAVLWNNHQRTVFFKSRILFERQRWYSWFYNF
jgi:hypothetical protein